MGCGSVLTNTIKPPKNVNTEETSEETFKKIKQIARGNCGHIFLIKSNKTKVEYALKAI